MVNIYEIIERARQLKNETKLDSISPERVGAIQEDTLKYINEYLLLGASPAIQKTYASVSAMQADSAPKSDLTGQLLKVGQLVVIVPVDPSSATAGDVYRYDGPSGNSSAWTYVAKIGGIAADADLSSESFNPVQNKVITKKLSELSQTVSTLSSDDYIPVKQFPFVGRINPNNGEVDYSVTSGGYKVSDFIAVSSTSVVKWYGGFPSQNVVCCYNSDKEFITSIIRPTSASATDLFEEIVPKNTKYVRVQMPYYYETFDTGFVGVKAGFSSAIESSNEAIENNRNAISRLGTSTEMLSRNVEGLEKSTEKIQEKVANLITEDHIIPIDNGVGGVTSQTTILQGGDVASSNFDRTRAWYAECVVKIVSGSVKILWRHSTNASTADGTYLRINNSLFQLSAGDYPVNIAWQNLGFLFGEWYHIMTIYKDNVVSIYVNGNLAISTNYTFPVSSGTEQGWEMDAIQSPKLLRVGYLKESDDVATIAAKHYNGNNPFGYDSSKDDLLVEFLPGNMLKTKIVNSANGKEVVYSAEKAFDIQTENPWAAVVRGEGAPTVLPVFVGQKYEDTLTGKTYTAVGNSTINDWSSPVTSQDLADLKRQTKTINGQSIWGSGDISVGGAAGGGSSQYISVVDKGAVGDGQTDDTSSIMNALELARSAGKALYFPNGTYLTRKSLVLTSNMHIIGEPGAVLQNAAATIEGGGKCPYTTLTQTAARGATEVVVSSASKLRVGDEIVIWKSGSYTETMADIVAINGNTLSIDTSRFTADGQNGGILNEVASGGYVLTDFALIKTIMTKAADNVIVEGITLKALSDINEPHIYPSSPISQTKQTNNVSQRNFRVIGVTIYDSANDGISLQGAGEGVVIGCRIYNQKHKGIHWGTSHDMIRVEGNYVYGCGSATYDNPLDYQGSGAMFFCSNTHRTIIRDNFVENCYRGIYGFNYQDKGEQDTDTLISGNTFKNCGLYGVLLRGGYRAIVTDNTFIDFDKTSVPLRTEQDDNVPFLAGVISNNVFGEFGANFTGVAMQITGAKNLSVCGNIVSDAVANSTEISRGSCDMYIQTCEKIVVSGNVVSGDIVITDSTNIINVNNLANS